MFDVTIVGAGVIGCSIARELSKYNLKVCVLEKGPDVATGTSKANSGIVHGGHDATPGTLKAKLNVRGNEMFDKLVEELDFPFKRNGSLVLCFDESEKEGLQKLLEKGQKNGVPNLEIIGKERILEMEPNVNDDVVGALYVPTGGIVCPYEMTIAMAENAYTNGVEFKFETEVKNVVKKENGFTLETSKGNVETNLVINAAGLFSDDLNNMVSKNKIEIIARKGEYCLFDKTAGAMATKTLFQLPTKMGKGVLVTPTVDGNLLIGPNAVDVEDKTDVDTTQEGIDDILNRAKKTFKQIPMRQVITSFSGLRSHDTVNDFIIGEAEDVPGFINVAGIESPGLSSAPAIAEMVEGIVVEKLSPAKNDKFNPIREGIPKFREMTNEERKELIAKDPSYGKIVCRCETVTEGEILNAIRRPLGAKDLDGIKRRTRAGMGKCQSGFCSTKIVALLSKELGIPETEVTKFGGKSNLLIGEDKEI
ncbi:MULTISPECIES: NAD(P)/FAD-dependent oxidoreductase [Clostridium]|uniref:Glycerol-3-phosphate dehydrogenase n=1 Tax=Clostridium novyi (strain NT) TaxID=386415 RepID=A0Q376_CLONN|nr:MULTISPECIES: NAD(P)/FAD-dependent oxidoreductase [Clostridium]ABK62113.1 glycerol-3-phosphate dehydrogenase [Clostridium novyi NT]KEH87534.1 FAD-dependent oxidoreductase [Clostridium novyi A str. NCTC 538]KEH88301.1 FAD-dependent oxidoreductase [Clostridium novyi A str. 4540]KEH91166.1 FAD-dependent oxidoreductase [Clostridium novyi A str. BKT29909]KEH94829.1 FAD-dependent oxidoreductase [Clostridium botulinum C/D str. It1]